MGSSFPRIARNRIVVNVFISRFNFPITAYLAIIAIDLQIDTGSNEKKSSDHKNEDPYRHIVQNNLSSTTPSKEAAENLPSLYINSMTPEANENDDWKNADFLSFDPESQADGSDEDDDDNSAEDSKN